MPFQTLLFDLDGTVTDSALGVTRSFAYALDSFGIREDPANLFKVVGPPLHVSFMEFYGFSKEDAFRAVDKYREYYREKGIYECRLYDGIRELLAKLKASGRELLIASSKPEFFVKQILENFGIAGEFDFVAGSLLDGSRTDKAEVVDYALSHAKGGIGGTVMIGDRCFDVDGGHAKGLPVIGVSWGYGSRRELADAGAEYIVDSPEELFALLMSDCDEK
ncbi:MAG: HAD hydrolase-like protein [Eubacteriales bacterium]